MVRIFTESCRLNRRRRIRFQRSSTKVLYCSASRFPDLGTKQHNQTHGRGVTTLYRAQKETTCKLFWRTNLDLSDVVKV